MKYIKTVILPILVLACLTLPTKTILAKTLDEYNPESLPIPENFQKVETKIDITQNAIYPIIKDFENNILSHLDPLSFERDFGNTPPDYDFLQFQTEMHPKQIFEFYKDFYENLDGGKSYSEMHYDTSAGDSPTMCKNNEIVYYTIKLGTKIDSKELYFSISAFRGDPSSQTEVYIFTYKK